MEAGGHFCSNVLDILYPESHASCGFGEPGAFPRAYHVLSPSRRGGGQPLFPFSELSWTTQSLVCPSLGGHSGCFHVPSVGNRAAVNMCIQTSEFPFSGLWGFYLRVELLGLLGILWQDGILEGSLFDFLRKRQTLPSSCPVLQSHLTRGFPPLTSSLPSSFSSFSTSPAAAQGVK